MRSFTAVVLLLALARNASLAFSPIHSTSRGRLSQPSGSSSSRVTLNLCNGLFGSCSAATSDEPILNNRHSASDWLYNVRSLPQSKVLREIKKPVLAVAAWSLVVSVFHRVLASCGQESLRAFSGHMLIPGTAHGFLVSALGLLLVFRTNSAYQRFYEGRKIWENILSVSRNLSRMIQLYSKEVGSERKQRILNLVAAYPYLLRHHIRPGCLCEENDSIIPEAHKLLLQMPSKMPVETRHEGDKDPDAMNGFGKLRNCWVDTRKLPWSLFENTSVEKIALASNRPMWVCDRIGSEVVSIPYGPNFTSRERLTMLSKVEKLTDAVGQCERIHQTAVPLNYARHSLRSLTLWLFTLPFALIKDLGLMTAPVTACIAWLLFGVYQIGYSIEDPFQGSLRLSILCDAIRRDVIGDSKDSKERHSAFAPEDNMVEAEVFPTADNTVEDEVLPTEPILIDEQLLNAPMLVEAKNGTWNVVSLVDAT